MDLLLLLHLLTIRVSNRTWLRPCLNVSIWCTILLVVKVNRRLNLRHLLFHDLFLLLITSRLIIFFFFNDIIVLLLIILITDELDAETELRFKLEWIQEFRKEIVELNKEVFLLVRRVRVMNISDTAEEVDELRIR